MLTAIISFKTSMKHQLSTIVVGNGCLKKYSYQNKKNKSDAKTDVTQNYCKTPTKDPFMTLRKFKQHSLMKHLYVNSFPPSAMEDGLRIS